MASGNWQNRRVTARRANVGLPDGIYFRRAALTLQSRYSGFSNIHGGGQEQEAY